MASGPGSDRVPKKDRREAAREKARIMREEAARKAKRRKWILQGSITVGVLAVLAIIALVVVTSIQPAGPGPKNMASGGVLLTSTTKAVTTPAQPAGATTTPTKQSDDGLAHIITYVDYQCPICDQFETTNAEQIGQWIDQGIATLEIHPVAILDSRSNGNRYSTRAANAVACVANFKPDDVFAVNSALFKNQPPEGGNGMTDDELLSVLKGAGASSSAITSCVKDETFSSWVTAQTDAATSDQALVNPTSHSFGTPTVLVNGTMYPGSISDASAFLSFVSSAVSAGSSTSTPAPTTSPTPAG